MDSKNGDEQNRLLEAADEFSKAPIFIDDSSGLSVMQLRAKARRVHSMNPLGFIVVDYLQLLSPTDPKVAYAAVASTLYQTRDDARTWNISWPQGNKPKPLRRALTRSGKTPGKR